MAKIQYLSTTDAAVTLGISRHTLLRLRQREPELLPLAKTEGRTQFFTSTAVRNAARVLKSRRVAEEKAAKAKARAEKGKSKSGKTTD